MAAPMDGLAPVLLSLPSVEEWSENECCFSAGETERGGEDASRHLILFV